MVVVPLAMPVMIPVLPDVATVIFEDVHTPPLIGSVSVIVLPSQTKSSPEIVPATGSAFTVIVWVATALPQPLLTK
jgi:hypothetical protein